MSSEVIAESLFRVKEKNGSTSLIQIILKRPVQNIDWQCDVEIKSSEETMVHKIFGVDSYQALRLAVKFAEVRIDSFRKEYGERFSFFDDDKSTN